MRTRPRASIIALFHWNCNWAAREVRRTILEEGADP